MITGPFFCHLKKLKDFSLMVQVRFDFFYLVCVIFSAIRAPRASLINSGLKKGFFSPRTMPLKHKMI